MNPMVIGVLLIIIGVGLLIAETFIPSFGVVGISGLVMILFGVIFVSESFFGGLILLIGILLITFVAMFILYKVLASKKSPLILKEKSRQEIVIQQDLIGQVGLALTPLRPAGTVELGKSRIDVVTQGEFIKKGTPVIVLKIEGRKIMVGRKGE